MTHYELMLHTRNDPGIKDVYIEDYHTREGAERAGRAMMMKLGFVPSSPDSNHYTRDSGEECEECEVVVVYRGDKPE